MNIYGVLEVCLGTSQHIDVVGVRGRLVDDRAISDPRLQDLVKLANRQVSLFVVLHDLLCRISIAITKLHDRADRPFEHEATIPVQRANTLAEGVKGEQVKLWRAKQVVCSGMTLESLVLRFFLN